MDAVRFFARVLGWILLLTAAGTGSARADDASRATANVSVRIIGTSRSGRSGAAESAARHTLTIGQTAIVGVYGDFDGAIGSGGWPAGGSDSYAWRVEARLLAVSFETVELSVTWSRREPCRRGQGPGFGDTRVLKLSGDQRHVLDLVQPESPASTLANLFVEVEAARAADDDEPVRLEYDFWLVHQSRAGRQTTAHRSYGGYQGEKRSADFTPLGFAFDGGVVADGSDAPLSVSVKARLIARLRPDGRMEVTLGTDAWLECGAARSGGSGVKDFVARDGETVRVEVPASFGGCTVSREHALPTGARPGLTGTAEGLHVSSRDFFDGDQFSLLVRVRRFAR